VLAGRSAGAIERLAGELSCPFRVFDLREPARIVENIGDAHTVLHCAGPFVDTAPAMIDACLRAGVNYLDITGEIEVYQALHGMHTQAKGAGIMLLPGAGFDVAPSDCLAVHLKSRLPSATHLALAFRGYGPAGLSRGTARTSIENMGQPSSVRRDGAITPVAHVSKSRQIDFGRGAVSVQRVKWGDVFTAYHSAGIPNIENYIAVRPLIIFVLGMARYLGWLLRLQLVKRLLTSIVQLMPPGPTDKQIEQSGSVVWGEVVDAEGNRAVARLHGPEAYKFTALASLEIARRVLSGDAPPGYQTPASAYGPDWILEIEGVSRQDVD